MARLTAEEVGRMRAMRADGALLRELADAFGVSISLASQICRGDLWRLPG
jgi:hypothetical protein